MDNQENPQTVPVNIAVLYELGRLVLDEREPDWCQAYCRLYEVLLRERSESAILRAEWEATRAELAELIDEREALRVQSARRDAQLLDAATQLATETGEEITVSQRVTSGGTRLAEPVADYRVETAGVIAQAPTLHGAVAACRAEWWDQQGRVRAG